MRRTEAEPGGDVGRCGDPIGGERGAAIVMAALADFTADAGDLQQGQLRLVLGDETADAGDPHDAALLHEVAQRPVDGHTRHAELLHQLVFRRQAMARRPGAVLDAPDDIVLDLLIARRRFHALL